MKMVSACRRSAAQTGRNRTALSIQQAECGKKMYFMACICVGHHRAAGEESSGYAAEQMTEWFWREFVKGGSLDGRRVKKSLAKLFRELDGTIRARENRLGPDSKTGRRGVSVECVFLCGRKFWCIHLGNGSCCRISGRRAVFLNGPHVIGDSLLIRTLGGAAREAPEFICGRLKRQETLLLGAYHFPGRWSKRELVRLWNPRSAAREETAALRLEEMCGKRIRQGENTEQAAAVVIVTKSGT